MSRGGSALELGPRPSAVPLVCISLEKGALQRRGSHMATRGRKSLDRELEKVDTSLSQAVEVD